MEYLLCHRSNWFFLLFHIRVLEAIICKEAKRKFLLNFALNQKNDLILGSFVETVFYLSSYHCK